MSMLVIMRPEATRDEVAGVCRCANELGFEATMFEGEPGVIAVAGAYLTELAEHVAELPGVTRVAQQEASGKPITSNLRIAGIRPLVPPAILVEELPLPDAGAVMVQQTRQETS